MNKQKQLQAQADKVISKNEEIMKSVCLAPVVTDDETAEGFGKGLQKWYELTTDERKKLEKLDPTELVKHYDDRDIAAAGDIISRSVSNVNKALTGTLHRAKSGEALAEAMPLIVDNGITTADDLQFDMGWTPAFNVVGASNADFIKVIDMRGAMRMIELADRTDKIPAQSLATKKSESFGPRFFGGAFNWHMREMRFSVYNLNNALTAMRSAAVNNITIHAYRILCDMKSTSKEWGASELGVNIEQGSGTYREQRYNLTSRFISMLNQGRFRLINEASNKQKTSGKRKQTPVEAPISGLTADSPVYCYVNHKWFEEVGFIQRFGPGEDISNVARIGNIVFVSSIHVPECGAHTVTESTERDDWGFLESISPKDEANVFGGKLVLPGRRNMIGIFRPNTIFSDSGESVDESIKITIKQEQDGVLDSRQHAYLKFGEVKFS